METFECIYCGAEIEGATDYQGVSREPVPAIDDDEGWETAAQEHAEDCEWIRTRAHQIYHP